MALPVGGALAAASLGLAAYTGWRLNGPWRGGLSREYTFSPWELQVDYETVEFSAPDGVMIRGWWLDRPASQRVVLGCTGHRGAKHELLGIGSGLWRAGHNVLLFDFRGRGDSDLAACSLAFHELSDLGAALDYAMGRVPAARLGVVGYSMGAAVAILGAARDDRIAAVVADSPFATMRDVIRHAFRRRRVPIHPMLDLADWVNRLRYGYAYDSVQPLEAVAAIAPRPLLLIHGDADSVIPVEHSRQIFTAAGEPRELWVVPGAEHCGGYFVDRQHYVAHVTAFFDRWLHVGAAA
jgi:dipeptidyl aminopeptidase/acylaminoacyl peptidase